jgi:hypothetical protein
LLKLLGSARGRALYGEAQTKIQAWIERRQRLVDQPFLDRAQQLAAGGNLAGAIEMARRIRSGRVLYEEAQSNIRTWEAQFEGEQGLQSARQSRPSWGLRTLCKRRLCWLFRCPSRVRSGGRRVRRLMSGASGFWRLVWNSRRRIWLGRSRL